MVERLERETKKYQDFAATIFALPMLDTHFWSGHTLLLQTSIAGLIRWNLHHFDRVSGSIGAPARESTTSNMIAPSRIYLLGITRVGPARRYGPEGQVVPIIEGFALKTRITLSLDALVGYEGRRTLDKFHAEINAVKSGAETENTWRRQSSSEARDWKLSSGFAEDTRDQYYCYLVDEAVSRRPQT